MTKKSFEDMDLTPNYTNIADAAAEPVKERRPRREYSQFEAQALAMEGKTQGRKGAAMPRFNISLSPQNAEFVRLMARASGRPATTFINDIITKYRQEHGENYEKARLLLKEIDLEI